MTTTTRRTAKITQPARGFVAIKVDYIAAATTRIACVANKDMTIKGVNGASVTIKEGEAFWLVRAGSLGADMFYVVREVSGEKKCSCPANKPCKHEVSLAKHIAEHGRPELHLRATEHRAEQSRAKAERIAEESRDLVAVAVDNAAQAGQGIDRALIASAVQSERRMTAPINGSRAMSIAPIVAPVIAVSRVPMR